MKLKAYIKILQKIEAANPDITVTKNNGMGGLTSFINPKVETAVTIRNGETMTADWRERLYPQEKNTSEFKVVII